MTDIATENAELKRKLEALEAFRIEEAEAFFARQAEDMQTVEQVANTLRSAHLLGSRGIPVDWEAARLAGGPDFTERERELYAAGYEMGWDSGHNAGFIGGSAFERVRQKQRVQAIFQALDKLNQHHTHEHHHDDPDMPLDPVVAAGYLAYEQRGSLWKEFLEEKDS